MAFNAFAWKSQEEFQANQRPTRSKAEYNITPRHHGMVFIIGLMIDQPPKLFLMHQLWSYELMYTYCRSSTLKNVRYIATLSGAPIVESCGRGNNWCFAPVVDCMQSLSFLVHSNWETGASERHISLAPVSQLRETKGTACSLRRQEMCRAAYKQRVILTIRSLDNVHQHWRRLCFQLVLVWSEGTTIFSVNNIHVETSSDTNERQKWFDFSWY